MVDDHAAYLPLSGSLTIGTDEDLVRLNEAAWQVLERTGFKVYSQRLLARLAELGARVDTSTMIAHFPRGLLEERLDCHLQPEVPDTPVRAGADYRPGFGEVCFFIYDYQTGERRPATRQQAIDMIRLGQAIPEVGAVSTPVVNSQIDQRLEALESAALLIANTDKRGGTGVRCPEQVPYFVEIDRLCNQHGSDRRFVQTGGCLTSPLTLGERTAQIVERLMDYGYDSFGFSSMPIAGGNAPVTAAGCAVMGIAELLGGRLVARAINPAASGVGMMISGAMDMTHGRASFCSPQGCLQDALIWRVFRRLYGVSVSLDRCGSYINAKTPGLQCAYERTFKQMALAATTGSLGLHLGSLDGAAIFSPEQAIVDLDLCRGLWNFARGVPISGEALALETINEVGVGEGRSYLATDHTVQHFREALWMPRLLDVSMWHDGEEAGREQELLSHASHQWREHLANWRQPDIDEDLLAAVHKVVAQASRDLGV